MCHSKSIQGLNPLLLLRIRFASSSGTNRNVAREQIEMLIASSCINNIQFFAYIKSYLVAPHLRVPLLAVANGLDKLSVSRLFRLYHSIGNEEHQKTLGAHIEQRGLNHNDLKKLIKLLFKKIN